MFSSHTFKNRDELIVRPVATKLRSAACFRQPRSFLPKLFVAADGIVVIYIGRKVGEKIIAGARAEELVQDMVGARVDAAA